uniref:Uncharacterized protein n=1 Tax=Rhizophora mucronata TaxID=61149 RepID=A0A2P2PC94_RHIMU
MRHPDLCLMQNACFRSPNSYPDQKLLFQNVLYLCHQKDF